jgi:hypothetical protein
VAWWRWRRCRAPGCAAGATGWTRPTSWRERWAGFSGFRSSERWSRAGGIDVGPAGPGSDVAHPDSARSLHRPQVLCSWMTWSPPARRCQLHRGYCRRLGSLSPPPLPTSPADRYAGGIGIVISSPSASRGAFVVGRTAHPEYLLLFLDSPCLRRVFARARKGVSSGGSHPRHAHER